MKSKMALLAVLTSQWLKVKAVLVLVCSQCFVMVQIREIGWSNSTEL